MKTKHPFLALLTLALLFVGIGCDTADPDLNDTTTGASEDVALSVSTLLSEETGGLLDQVGDVFMLATDGDLDETTAGKTEAPAERTYDEATGTWTISFSREYGSPEGPRYATIQRLYEVQFLDEHGDPQQFLVTDGDTAHSIAVTVLEGSGTLETPHVSAARTNITASFVATGVHTDLVTVNGTYSRSGAHTLTTEQAVRTLDYDLSIDVQDLVGPKGSRRDLSQKISGTLHGLYTGTTTFERGERYRERDIERAVTIVIEDGEATITVNGEDFAGNLETGDVAMN